MTEVQTRFNGAVQALPRTKDDVQRYSEASQVSPCDAHGGGEILYDVKRIAEGTRRASPARATGVNFA